MDNQALQNILQEYFQWFHRHPEIGWQEFKTTEHIRKILTENGVELLDSNLPTGLIAVIRGKEERPVVALRCDIDALPIEETAEVPYRSEHPGRMHACGHDFHTTAMLGAALQLQSRRAELEGTIKLLFQPAEEAEHGALSLLETGLLDDVSEIYGLHVHPGLKTGTIAAVAGADHAAVDRFFIQIEGIGCHAAHPESGVDPVPVAAQLINAFQTIVSRNVSAFERAVVSITKVHGGTAWNAIPSSVELEGTVRTLQKDTRKHIQTRMQEICAGIGAASSTQITFQWKAGCPSTNNDAQLVQFVIDTAKSLGFSAQEAVPSMGGEDFSYYQEKIKGAFWMVGVGESAPLHNSAFKADLAALTTAAKLLCEIAVRRLSEIAK